MTLLDANKSQPLEGGPSYSKSNRILRAGWIITWKLLASWTPPPFRLFRIALIRAFGGKIDWSANVYSSARIWLPQNLTMEARSCIGPRVNCYCMGQIKLRPGAIVSQDVTLCAASHDVDAPHFQLTIAPIEIGNGAWIAAEAFVGPGVHIGDHAVVGARCVLFRNADPFVIYAGNPAKPIRKRDTAFGREDH